ncbi:hypothetical protein ADL03_41695 [Nocardia sp. NRRL S-836]|nr:hypothetical protein ADL03_41695 [Nocardia sp. NRRL S-836]
MLVDLSSYDLILVNESGGKDSQAMLTHVVGLCDAAGIDRWRIVVVHADLGRVEWRGTRELAELHAKAYGLRFEAVSRSEDLLDQVISRRAALDRAADKLEAEGKPDEAAKKRNAPAWMSMSARYCTSDQKTSQVKKLMTRLVVEHRTRNPGTVFRPVRILNCLGLRKQESPARSKKPEFEVDKSATNGKRHVDRWLPIFGWSTEQVWSKIRQSGLPHHPAYDAGMPRASCVFCIGAGREQLVLAARLHPELAAEYLAVEQRVGHSFKPGLSMARIIELSSAAQVGTQDETA